MGERRAQTSCVYRHPKTLSIMTFFQQAVFLIGTERERETYLKRQRERYWFPRIYFARDNRGGV